MVLPGCADLVEVVAQSCPTDPTESGGVTWTPDIAHPVFWGVQDLTVASGAPRNLRIFYPTVEGFTSAPPILKLCLVRWPVVLFLHGQPPAGIPTNGYHRRWWQLPAVLARSGFVVVVPSHLPAPPTEDAEPAVAAALRDIDWVRTQWSDSTWVHKQPEFTAVAGHSWGAMLAARVAAARPAFAAFVSLSGPYLELGPALPSLTPVAAPSFLMWANGNGPGIDQEDLDGPNHLWDQLTQPRYSAVYQGEHFDYLPESDTGRAPRGSCPAVGAVAADLAALFIAANIQVPLSRTTVGVDLQPPRVSLTQRQEFFAGAHLQGLGRFQSQPGCRLDLRWVLGNGTGSRRLGP